MYYIRTILQTLFPVEQRLLGRWALNQSKEKLDKKIDWANYDHCGPCGSLMSMYPPSE